MPIKNLTLHKRHAYRFDFSLVNKSEFRTKSTTCGETLHLSQVSPVYDASEALLGREPINLLGGRLARVRYATIADHILQRNDAMGQ
jgi:hypothetical protein